MAEITKEQAMAELARRELARRESTKTTQTPKPELTPSEWAKTQKWSPSEKLTQAVLSKVAPDMLNDMYGTLQRKESGQTTPVDDQMIAAGSLQKKIKEFGQSALLAETGVGLASKLGAGTKLSLAAGGALGTQPFDYQSPQERIMATAGATIAGPALVTAGELVGKGIGLGKRIIDAGKKIKAVEAELSNQPIKALAIKNDLRAARANKTLSAREMVADMKETSARLFKAMNSDANLESQSAKKVMRDTFQDMTKTYRTGLDNAETALAARGETITGNEYVSNVVNKTLDDIERMKLPSDSRPANIMRRISQALQSGERETGILNAEGRMILLPEADKPISLSDLKLLKNEIYDTLSSASKSGAKYLDEYDKTATAFLGNHGKFIGTKSPELAQLNAEFAPMAQARRWAMKNFKPYTPEEIQRGADILKNLGSAKAPNQTNLNYLQRIEAGSGQFKGTGKLNAKSLASGKQIKEFQESYDLAKKNLIDAADYRISKLQNEMAELNRRKIDLGFRRDDLKKLITTRNYLIGLGVAGAALAVPQTKKAVSTITHLAGY